MADMYYRENHSSSILLFVLALIAVVTLAGAVYWAMGQHSIKVDRTTLSVPQAWKPDFHIPQPKFNVSARL